MIAGYNLGSPMAVRLGLVHFIVRTLIIIAITASRADPGIFELVVLRHVSQFRLIFIRSGDELRYGHWFLSEGFVV